jgi:hypothetical protein
MIATALAIAGSILSFIGIVLLVVLILGGVFAGIALCIGIVCSSVIRFAAYRFLVNTCKVITFGFEPNKCRKIKRKIKTVAESQ